MNNLFYINAAFHTFYRIVRKGVMLAMLTTLCTVLTVGHGVMTEILRRETAGLRQRLQIREMSMSIMEKRREVRM